MGSSIVIDFVPLQDNTSIIGFALCIVIDCDQCFLGPDDLEVGCKYISKTDNHRRNFHWTLQRVHNAYDCNSNNMLDWSSDLVFIWHLFAREITRGDVFEFYLRQPTAAFGKDRVKQCGISVLYHQDATYFIERAPRKNINSDTNEPHPKRIKFSKFF